MTRCCPLCPNQSLERRSVSGQVIDACSQCHGFWLDRADLLPLVRERQALISLMAAARHAPGRCRKKNHAVPPSRVSCPVCQAPPTLCPCCEQRLATAALGAWGIDVCVRCEGLWVDAGKEAALAQLKDPARSATKSGPPSAPTPAGSLQGWEVPEATDVEGRDPYLSPGHQQALRHHPKHVSGLICQHCDVQMSGEDAYAFEGNIYCVECRPEGAVSGRQGAESWFDRLLVRK